jgi:hypothetical protein
MSRDTNLWTRHASACTCPQCCKMRRKLAAEEFERIMGKKVTPSTPPPPKMRTCPLCGMHL